MPLYLTSSHSSRVRKPAVKTPSLRTSTSSPFSNLPRRKPVQRTKSVDNYKDACVDQGDEKLDDIGTTISLATISPVKGVIETIKHSHATMFSDIPERAGMNSTRIAEVLNFRGGLPPIVSLAHVHGLLTASTQTEREIAGLIASGDLRKLTVSGRGNEISGLCEFLILNQDLEACIRNGLPETSVASK
jgi:Serine-threonine protein kinase 19